MGLNLTRLLVMCGAVVAIDQPTKVVEPSAESALAVQVALDRAGYSPGEIDGRMGRNTLAALSAFRAEHGVPAGNGGSDELPAALGEHAARPLVEYTVTEADLAGPFVRAIPSDLMEQARLESLGYTSPWEMLGERFHASPALLQKLNAVSLVPGVVLRVPNVEPTVMPERTGPRQSPGRATSPAARIVVAARPGTLTVRDAAGRLLVHAPVTVGGARDPLPTGRWKAIAILDLPVFNYNPDLFWDADPSHAKARIAPGPNNPVGVVWIDLDLENYGIHGTPEPSRIGRTESHGCVRLTNWDALRVAAVITRNTPVIFE